MITTKCPKCGYEFRAESILTICPQCFYQFSTTEKYRFKPRKKSTKPTIAGILLVVVSVLTLIAALALFASHSVLENYPIDGASAVYGRVTDKNGNGIENVRVDILELSTETNSTGYYRLDRVNWGVHKIKIYKEGNNTVIAKILVLRDISEDFTLTPGNSTIEEDRTEEFFALIYSCGTIQIVFLVFTLLAGIFAIKRKHFGVCIVGSVLGILSLFVIVGTVLSIVALVLLAQSKDEFS